MDLFGETTPQTKRCSQCKQHKPLDAFGPTGMRNGKMRLHSWCKTCHARIHREQGQTPEVRKRWRESWKRNGRKKLYGITPEQYDAMFEAQGGLCAVCGKPETVQRKTGTTFSLAVEHDHSSGAVRGLCCGNCNRGIAAFLDNPALLRAAAEYLERHATQEA